MRGQPDYLEPEVITYGTLYQFSTEAYKRGSCIACQRPWLRSRCNVRLQPCAKPTSADDCIRIVGLYNSLLPDMQGQLDMDLASHDVTPGLEDL